MTFHSKTTEGVRMHDFSLAGVILKTVNKIKYLGHYIVNDLSDNTDIDRQCRQLYIQGNSLMRKFHMCTWPVKLTLFRSYCSPMYTSQLWWNYSKQSINKLYVSYHNIFKMLLGVSKFERTSMLCTVLNVQCCQSINKNIIFRFMNMFN